MSADSDKAIPLAAFLIPVAVAAAGVFGIVRSLDSGSHLSDGATTRMVETQPRKNRPPAPVIEVDGERYVCSGGRRLTDLDAEVRYDPEKPKDCRLAETVGVMTSQERFNLWLSIAAVGFSVFLVFLVARRDD